MLEVCRGVGLGVFEPGGVMNRVYLDTGGAHWVTANKGTGSTLVLEDGSHWDVSLVDRMHTLTWLPMTNVRVRGLEISPGDYELFNEDAKESASAKFLGD